MNIAQRSIDLIGNTPVQVLNNIREDLEGQVWGKLEYLGPGSSIKDRIAKFMVEKAEGSGELKSGYTIIEATAGNTGVGLALVAAAKGYDFICIMPQKFSLEKQQLIEFMGGKVLRTPTEDGMKGAIAKAVEIREELGQAWIANQFSNSDNPLCHYLTTGREIWEQTDGKIDARTHPVHWINWARENNLPVTENLPQLVLAHIEKTMTPTQRSKYEAKFEKIRKKK